MDSARSDLGPALPSRLSVYATAAELHVLARLALELTVPGPKADVARALKQLDKARALLGAPDG